VLFFNQPDKLPSKCLEPTLYAAGESNPIASDGEFLATCLVRSFELLLQGPTSFRFIPPNAVAWLRDLKQTEQHLRQSFCDISKTIINKLPENKSVQKHWFNCNKIGQMLCSVSCQHKFENSFKR